MSEQTHTPCPFCGHLNARLRVRLAAGSYSAFCGACLAEGPAAATAAEAEAAWDRRTGPVGDAPLSEADALARLRAGESPDAVLAEYRDRLDAAEAVVEKVARAEGWNLWDDGEWREATACSICGSYVPGICGHQDDPAQVVLVGKDAVRRYGVALVGGKEDEKGA